MRRSAVSEQGEGSGLPAGSRDGPTQGMGAEEDLLYGRLEDNTSLRDEAVLEVESLEPRGAGSKRKPGALESLWTSPLFRSILRSFLCLAIPVVLFYIESVHDWLGKQGEPYSPFCLFALSLTALQLTSWCSCPSPRGSWRTQRTWASWSASR